MKDMGFNYWLNKSNSLKIIKENEIYIIKKGISSRVFSPAMLNDIIDYCHCCTFCNISRMTILEIELANNLSKWYSESYTKRNSEYLNSLKVVVLSKEEYIEIFKFIHSFRDNDCFNSFKEKSTNN